MGQREDGVDGGCDVVETPDPKKPDANSGMDRLDPQMRPLVKALGLSFAKERKRARAEQKQMLETLAYELGAKFGELKSEHRAEIEQLKAEVGELRAEQARTLKANPRKIRRAA
jgi:hypothetical protein